MDAIGNDIPNPPNSMLSRVRSQIFWAIVSLGVIGIACFVYLRGAGSMPVIAEVVEPIAVIDGGSYEDGGSQFIRFRDAAGVTRYACLLDELHGRQNLEIEDHEVPLYGADEQAFLELLERW